MLGIKSYSQPILSSQLHLGLTTEVAGETLLSSKFAGYWLLLTLLLGWQKYGMMI